jgi:hypothetical protein
MHLQLMDQTLIKMFAFLNRTSAATSSHHETPNWFYRTFGVEHLEPYRTVFIGSHGGHDTFNATIENRRLQGVTPEITAQSVSHFTQEIQRSIGHITINPLPVDTYLNELQSKLKFLPRDW